MLQARRPHIPRYLREHVLEPCSGLQIFWLPSFSDLPVSRAKPYTSNFLVRPDVQKASQNPANDLDRLQRNPALQRIGNIHYLYDLAFIMNSPKIALNPSGSLSMGRCPVSRLRTHWGERFEIILFCKEGLNSLSWVSFTYNVGTVGRDTLIRSVYTRMASGVNPLMISAVCSAERSLHNPARIADSGGFVPMIRMIVEISILWGNGITDKKEPPFFGIAAPTEIQPANRSFHSDASRRPITPPSECATITNLRGPHSSTCLFT